MSGPPSSNAVVGSAPSPADDSGAGQFSSSQDRQAFVAGHKVTWGTHEASSPMPDYQMGPVRADGNATTTYCDDPRNSLARTFVAHASAPSPDWNISSDTSAPTLRRNPSSVPNTHDASPVATCYCVTSRSCTRPQSESPSPNMALIY
ncbi:hypothetical protein G7Z17_g2534 [Cylindrodendrum hubeiense]|uniref:Uncharacterized protein n=1 Tax=Cylindrodendrum hubeiense TaxID=595255 RepID=A0A9P5HHC1_9HYPO|nr:hypothetical protein G7Z17_g2534 [Cylindrodendrum hubeiense]